MRGALAVLASSIAYSVLGAQPASLTATFIGNMAFAITDGTTTLYTDFPYESGAFGYMEYDFEKVPKAPTALCLITHGHRDHFDRALFQRMDAKIIAPPELGATLPSSRVIPLAPRMTYRGIVIEPIRTPHGSIGHRSYLVTWNGLRLYFTGDTDSTGDLLATKNLDAAFVSPWILAKVHEQGARIDARRVIVYHHKPGETVPAFQDALVPKQGERIVLESGEARSPFRERRAEAMRRVPDGILLLRSRSFSFHSDQDYLASFQQDPNFYYLTGLSSAVGAVLAIDGASMETWLFVPEKLRGVAGLVKTFKVETGEASAKRLGLDHVVSREELAGFLVRREEARPELLLYAPGTGGEHDAPQLEGALDDPGMAWTHALGELWPQARIRNADALLSEMRAIKSPDEIETLRRVGEASAAALRAGLRALSPGRPQREAEARVVSACIAAGAEGPSFWPWIMTGEASAFPAPMESLGDYRHLNRTMRAGDVARVDVGCDLGHYKGDVGRTAPVGGRFDAGQRETWELLVAAYRAGLAVIRDGAKSDDVFAASLAAVRRRRPSLATPLGRQAAETLLGPDGLRWWEIHGVGLDSAEGLPETLRAGMTVDFEPIFSVEGQGFYLEDMILVTPAGHEILTPGLPYTADEIERATGAPAE